MNRNRFGILLAALCLLLAGCNWMDGSYTSVMPHQEQHQATLAGSIDAANYKELTTALEGIIADGTETATINIADYPSERVESGMDAAIRYARDSYCLGAYAVEDIHYEIGTSGGQPAVAVTVAYRRSLTERQRIRQVRDMEAAETVIVKALEGYEASAVLLVERYEQQDLTQLVQDYAVLHPQTVMETPQVTETIYGRGGARVVELIFTYENSREALRQMQSQVAPVFDSAALYVSGDGEQAQKFAQLYAFLMERFDYTVEKSLTPAYSLLRHGVGDSRAFATVYAAMCRRAGLECQIVTGTCSGEPWTWNMVNEGGYYYHVDLLRCSELGGYRQFTDADMRNYVWDYSAYPPCTGAVEPKETEETLPRPEPPEETEPGETLPEPPQPGEPEG